MVKVLHIGLGKSGSTFLQRIIFPKIAEKINIENINPYKNNFYKIKQRKVKNHLFENVQNLEKFLPKNFILSEESLFSKSWEFADMKSSFNYLKDNFSNDTIILLVLRNPYYLLNSIFLHKSLNKMKMIKPDNFFYNEKNLKLKHKYNLYNFDYLKLISLYKSYFKKVVVVKYENLNNFRFLKEIFHLDQKFINYLKNYNKIIKNKSLSKQSVNMLFFLNKLFSVEKYENFLKKKIKKYSNKKIDKIKNKIFFFLTFRFLFQFFLDKIFFTGQKYYIDYKHIPLDIKHEILKYKKLKI